MMKKDVFLVLAILMMGVSLVGCSPKPTYEFNIQPSTAIFSAAGQTITYTYTVKNPNDEIGITITDDRFGSPCLPFILKPQGLGGPTEMTCTYTYTTTAADVQAGSIQNTATAAAHSAGPIYCGTEATNSVVASALVTLEPIPAVQVLSVGCDQDLAQVYITFDTGLNWLTKDADVTYSASDGQTGYNCHTFRTGVIRCTGTPGDSPSHLGVCVQRAGEPEPICMTIPNYPYWIEDITCEPDWELKPTGCYSEEEIFFTIDTGFTWLTSSNKGVTFSATDGDTTYACTVSAVVGRVFCYGPRPDNPGALHFCLQRKGDPQPVCQTFPKYPQSVWNLSCIPPTPTDRPGEHQPAAYCSSISSPGTCQTTSGCTWNTSTNKCEGK